MKKIVLLFSILFISSTCLLAQQPPSINIEVIVGNRPPSPNEAQLMRAEEGMHPNITRAMHDIEKSIKSLNEAPDDFGGHKGQAINDLRQGLISLRKALYFRLYRDTH
jgi:hypothetical protein